MRGLLVHDDLQHPLTRDPTFLPNKRTRFIDSEISLQAIPILIAVSCLSPVSTHTYLLVSARSFSKLPATSAYLDPGHLQRVDGVRHALLKLVLDSGCSEQEHVPLDELGGVVECVTAPVDRRRGLVVDRNPLPVLRLGDIATGDAERT